MGACDGLGEPWSQVLGGVVNVSHMGDEQKGRQTVRQNREFKVGWGSYRLASVCNCGASSVPWAAGVVSCVVL